MQKKPKTSLPDVLKNFSQLPDDAFVRGDVVCVLFGFSRSTLYRRISDGSMPAPSSSSPRVVVFNVGKLRAKLKGIAHE